MGQYNNGFAAIGEALARRGAAKVDFAMFKAKLDEEAKRRAHEIYLRQMDDDAALKRLDYTESLKYTPEANLVRFENDTANIGEFRQAAAQRGMPWTWETVNELMKTNTVPGRTSATDFVLNMPSDPRVVSPGSYGQRPDGTPKGPGFFGELPTPGGGVATELTVGVDGREIPSLVPGVTSSEREELFAGLRPPSVIQKAIDHARARTDQGLSPFAQNGEQPVVPLGQAGTFEFAKTPDAVTPGLRAKSGPELTAETSTMRTQTGALNAAKKLLSKRLDDMTSDTWIRQMEADPTYRTNWLRAKNQEESSVAALDPNYEPDYWSETDVDNMVLSKKEVLANRKTEADIKLVNTRIADIPKRTADAIRRTDIAAQAEARKAVQGNRNLDLRAQSNQIALAKLDQQGRQHAIDDALKAVQVGVSIDALDKTALKGIQDADYVIAHGETTPEQKAVAERSKRYWVNYRKKLTENRTQTANALNTGNPAGPTGNGGLDADSQLRAFYDKLKPNDPIRKLINKARARGVTAQQIMATNEVMNYGRR